MSIEEKKKDRFLFLKMLYEKTDGNAQLIISRFTIGKELGFDIQKTRNVVDYLKGEYLIESVTLDGGIKILHNGVVEIEESMSKPNEPTEHFSPVNFIHVENMHNSNIQQGTNNSTQTINYTPEKTNDLRDIIRQIEEIKNQLHLSGEIYDELVNDIDTIKLQLDSPKPKGIIITEILKSIMATLTALSGNSSTPQIIEIIKDLIG
jgi:hypothetical protein